MGDNARVSARRIAEVCVRKQQEWYHEYGLHYSADDWEKMVSIKEQEIIEYREMISTYLRDLYLDDQLPIGNYENKMNWKTEEEIKQFQ